MGIYNNRRTKIMQRRITMTIKKVTVAGGGVLGAQIAYAAAFHGFDVTIWGRSEGSIERVKPRVERVHNIYTKELEIAPSYIGL